MKNGKLYGSTYVPSGVNEEECYKFFDQFIKNEVGYIPATVYSYTKYESGWEQYDKILKSRNVFNSPDELDTNSELGYVCSVVETSNKPRYLPLNNGTVGTLEFGYFNTGEFIDLPADIVNLSISQGFSISGSLPVHTNKLSVTKDLTTNRIIFNFRNYLNNSNPIIEFDISTLSFVQPSPSLLFVAMGNCNFSTSESNLEFLSQFFIQRVYPKVTKLYTKNEIGWEQYNEIVDRAVTAEKLAYQSVTTDKVADKAIAFDKLSNNIQKILTFAIQHFGIVTFKDEEAETICVTNWDTNGDGLLTKEEISAVTNIGEVFRNTGITSFDELNNFTNLTSIPEYAFEGCGSLRSINIPSGVTSIGVGAFSRCYIISTINIPSGVVNIAERTFEDCSRLTTIILPEGLTNIGKYAFYECYDLTDITLPESVTSIEYGAFYYCSSLGSINILENSQLESIGDFAFYNCRSITSINIPQSVTNIGNRAFDGCTSLTSITIPENS